MLGAVAVAICLLLNVPTLHSLTVDVLILTLMMPLCLAVRFLIESYVNKPYMCTPQTPLGSGTVAHSLVWYVFREGFTPIKDLWKSTVIDSGGQYVTVDSVQMMLTLSVDSWDMILLDTTIIWLCKLCYK